MFLDCARPRTWAPEGEKSRKRFKRTEESNLQESYLSNYEYGLLLKIFSVLPFETVYCAGQTCKSWRDLSYNKDLLRILASNQLDAAHSLPIKESL